MRSEAGWGLRISTAAVLAFLHLPLLLIVVYAFSSERSSYVFPPPGLTTEWFAVAAGRGDVRAAILLSVQVACAATFVALLLGGLAALALARGKLRGGDWIALLFVLPIALPGIVTGIALRSAFATFDIDFSTWTIIAGHATFCMVIVYNNAVARLRRIPPSVIEASLDLGATGLQTFRHVVLPNLGSALLAGGLLAFALSFDEVIVTTFTAGQQTTLPIWIFAEMVRPHQRPVTNVVAVFVMAITLIPVLAGYFLTREDSAAR